MKRGRVSRSVRQWTNFFFLLSLLACAGYYSWRMCLHKVAEVPKGYIQTYEKTTGIIFRKTEILARTEGKHAASPKEVEAIQNGEKTCYPIGPINFDLTGCVETSGTMQGLKARIGLGERSFVDYAGSLSIDVDENSVKKIAAKDFLDELKESFDEAASDYSGLLKNEQLDEFKEKVSGQIQESLGLGSSKVSISLDKTEYKTEGVASLAMSLRDGQVIPPKILEEMPASGYVAIALALFATVFVYGLVRVLFEELFGLLFIVFIGFPLRAFGIGDFRWHEAGHYQTRRPRRSGVGDAALDIASAATDLIPHRVPDLSDVSDAADGIGSVGEAIGGIGEAAESLSAIGEAAGSIFDALGSIGDIF